jgi:hypothetical protein
MPHVERVISPNIRVGMNSKSQVLGTSSSRVAARSLSRLRGRAGEGGAATPALEYYARFFFSLSICTRSSSG